MFHSVIVVWTVRRDVQELGRDIGQTLEHYIACVKPAFEEFCLPVRREITLLWRLVPMRSVSCKLMAIYFCPKQTKKYADVIIPRGADNKGGSRLLSSLLIRYASCFVVFLAVAVELIVQHIQELINCNHRPTTSQRKRTTSESQVSRRGRPHWRMRFGRTRCAWRYRLLIVRKFECLSLISS